MGSSRTRHGFDQGYEAFSRTFPQIADKLEYQPFYVCPLCLFAGSEKTTLPICFWQDKGSKRPTVIGLVCGADGVAAFTVDVESDVRWTNADGAPPLEPDVDVATSQKQVIPGHPDRPSERPGFRRISAGRFGGFLGQPPL